MSGPRNSLNLNFQLAYEVKNAAGVIAKTIRFIEPLGKLSETTSLRVNTACLSLLEVLERLRGVDRRFREATR